MTEAEICDPLPLLPLLPLLPPLESIHSPKLPPTALRKIQQGGTPIMEIGQGAAIAISSIAGSIAWVATFWLVLRHRFRMKQLEVERTRFEAAKSQEETRQEILEFLDDLRAEIHSMQGGVAAKLEEVNERVDLTERMLLRASRARFVEQRESTPV